MSTNEKIFRKSESVGTPGMCMCVWGGGGGAGGDIARHAAPRAMKGAGAASSQ